MPQEVVCPHCGAVIGVDQASPPWDGATESLAAIDVAHTIETVLPGTICNDDQAHAEGLGIHMVTPHHHQNGSAEVFAEHTSYAPPPGSGSGEFDALASPVADPVLDAFVTEEPTASLIMPALGSHSVEDARSFPGTSASAFDARPRGPGEGVPDDEVEQRPPLTLVLLGSYASAATLAILWLLWSGPGRSTPPETLPRPSSPEVARRLAALTPLSEDRLTSIGKTITVGSLEFTTTEVKIGRVPLSGGGDGALILMARLKNISSDEIFAPLEKALIRPPDSGSSETLIEAGDVPIETYPLAISSERSLSGQSFQKLKPGETVETILVSDRDAKDKLSDSMTWRVRLRVNPSHASTVGVTFTRGEVR